MPPDEAREFRAALFDTALSRRVLGLGDDWEPYVRDDSAGGRPSPSCDEEA